MPSNTFDRFRLTGRTALVTGARREIGRAIALALAPCQDFALDDAGQRLAGTAWSPADILVLNASIDLPEAYRGITRQRFDKQISVNLRNPQTSSSGRGTWRASSAVPVHRVEPRPPSSLLRQDFRGLRRTCSA